MRRNEPENRDRPCIATKYHQQARGRPLYRNQHEAQRDQQKVANRTGPSEFSFLKLL